MIQFKNFNKISPALEKLQRKMQPGETVTFQMLGGIKNIDPDPQEMLKQPVFYAKTQIPTRQTIKDPETGKPVDIAVISIGENDTISFITFIAGINNGSVMPNYHANGRFTLSGDSLADQEILDVISLTDANQRNPNRDNSKSALFYEIIETEISTENNKRRNILREALNKAEALEMQEVKDIAAALRFPYEVDDVIVKDSVLTYAENEPSNFLSLLNDDLTPYKIDIAKAMSKGVVTYEPGEGKIKMGATVLAILAGFGNPSFDYVLKFSEWLKNTPDGQKQYNLIKSQLKSNPETE